MKLFLLSDRIKKNIIIKIFMEQLKNISETQEVEKYTAEVQKHIDEIPSWIWILLVMPKNPAAVTDKINEYRKLKAANDDRDSQSLHDYFTNK